MNIISFPALNITLNIQKTSFKIFNIEVYWYAVLIVSAMAIAIAIFHKRDGLYNIKFDDILDLLFFLIPISLISARLYYILFKLPYYLSNPIEMFDTRDGGMAIYGGIIGGVITCCVFCKVKKINLLDLFDYIVPGLVLGQAIGRWGNFINCEAYGITTTLPWRMGIFETGKYIEVHPTFLYESITCFIIFLILLIMKNKRKFKGQITYIYLILYSLERAFVEGLRTDSLMLGEIRISQLLSIIVFCVFSTIYVKKLINDRKTRKGKMS